MTKAESWIEENVVNQKEEIAEIAELSSRTISEKFHIGISPSLTMAMYGETYNAILDVLKTKESQYKEFEIRIAGILSISYTSKSDDEDEKQGNFMIHLQQINSGVLPDVTVEDDAENMTRKTITAWLSANITEQPEVMKEIEAKAVSRISSILGTKLVTSEMILPLFCTIHEQIISWIRIKRVDSGKTSYELDVCGLYDIIICETDDGDEKIEYSPSVYGKLELKSDSDALSYEEVDD